jgi:hypothetical protein
MLRTNGSIAAREQYSDEAGACVILPARSPVDRVPFGSVKFTIRYRFAGRVQPGIASKIPVPLSDRVTLAAKVDPKPYPEGVKVRVSKSDMIRKLYEAELEKESKLTQSESPQE